MRGAECDRKLRFREDKFLYVTLFNTRRFIGNSYLVGGIVTGKLELNQSLSHSGNNLKPGELRRWGEVVAIRGSTVVLYPAHTMLNMFKSSLNKHSFYRTGQARIQGRWNGWIFTPLFLSPLLSFFSYPSNIEIIFEFSDIITKFTPHFKILDPPLDHAVFHSRFIRRNVFPNL